MNERRQTGQIYPRSPYSKGLKWHCLRSDSGVGALPQRTSCRGLKLSRSDVK